MKRLGLLGGMSWESTVTYYQLINRRVRDVCGGLHSAPCIVYSFDFATIEALQRAGQWDEAARLLNDAAAAVQRAGADAIVLCTNTMHSVSDGMEAASGLPLLHIADCTGERIVAAGCRSVGLLGTRFTMEKDFYKSRLRHKHDLEVLVPDEEGRRVVHDIIYSELCNGIINEESQEQFYKVIDDLKAAGADCLVLGCTEIGLLVSEDEVKARCGLVVFDTTKIHALAAADWAMNEQT